MRIRNFLSVKTIIVLFLVGISNLQCDCKKLLNEDAEETKINHQAIADNYIAESRARSVAFSNQMAEEARLNAIAAKEEEEVARVRREALEQIAKSMEWQELEPLEHVFVPSIRLCNAERMQGYVQTLKSFLSKEAIMKEGLPEKLKQKAHQISERIAKEQRELKVIDQHLKERIAQSKQPKQDTSELSAEEQKAFEKAQLQAKLDLEDCQLIEELLNKIKTIKEEFRAILVAMKLGQI